MCIISCDVCKYPMKYLWPHLTEDEIEFYTTTSAPWEAPYDLI